MDGTTDNYGAGRGKDYGAGRGKLDPTKHLEAARATAALRDHVQEVYPSYEAYCEMKRPSLLRNGRS